MPVAAPCRFAVVILAVLGSLALAADQIEPAAALPTVGSEPWGADPLSRATLTTPGEGSGSLTTVAGHGSRFATVIELRTAKPVENPWELQASIANTGPVGKDDTIYVEFWMRTVSSQAESGEGTTSLILERKGDPWTKTLNEYAASGAGTGWTRRAFAARCLESYVPGEAQVNFHMGTFRTQVLQIGGLRVVDLGRDIAPESLPVHAMGYPGRSATAAWRAEAAARIERQRKNDLSVRVVDAAGRPVAGAQVSVVMTRPDFTFGSAIASDALLRPGPDGERYRAWVQAHCDKVVVENHLKWPSWEWGAKSEDPNWQRGTTLASLLWLQEHDIAIKGHNLIWPSWRFSPDRLKAMERDPQALAAACDEHIREILRATAPYGLVEWDVVNEAFSEKDIYQVLGGRQVLQGWFRLAREAYPVHGEQGGLLYNDYAHLVSAGMLNAHKRFAEDVVKELKSSGAPITAFGIQAHIGGNMSDPGQVMAELDRLERELAIDLHITEYDLNIRDEACQADYTRDFLTACFANPRVKSFLMWGFWEGQHWIPAGALYRRDWSAKPQATAVEQLLASWRTDATGTTDAMGTYQIRGFKGLHRVVVTVAGQERQATARIGDQPGTVVVRL